MLYSGHPIRNYKNVIQFCADPYTPNMSLLYVTVTLDTMTCSCYTEDQYHTDRPIFLVRLVYPRNSRKVLNFSFYLKKQLISYFCKTLVTKHHCHTSLMHYVHDWQHSRKYKCPQRKLAHLSLQTGHSSQASVKLCSM